MADKSNGKKVDFFVYFHTLLFTLHSMTKQYTLGGSKNVANSLGLYL